MQVQAPVIGGVYLTLTEDSTFRFKVDPGGETLEFTVLGQMELGIGMSPAVLQRCHELFADALAEVGRQRLAAVTEEDDDS